MRTLSIFAACIALCSLNACNKGGCAEPAKMASEVRDINPNYDDALRDFQGNTYQNPAEI